MIVAAAPDVCLVHPPYGALERPSLALSVLKACVRNAGISCEVAYLTFPFAEMIGTIPYADMVWVRAEMIGEWTFAGAAFPEFRPDHDAYLSRIVETYAPGRDAEASRIVDFLWRIRHKAEQFVETAAREIVARKPRIVGCSSTFNQHTASLALTRRIKQLDPSIVTILGGGNCEGEMGLTTVREFPWVDFVVSGEAEEVFPELCERVLRDGPERAAERLPFGALSARHTAEPAELGGAAAVPRAIAGDLDAHPLPDFDDYVSALDRFSGRRYVTPGLLFESSRGCWWGQISHCTFCGLNGSSMAYRSKSPARAVEELTTLARRYGIARFLVVDNILDLRYFDEMLPALAAAPEDLTLFYEIKANVTYEQLRILRDAGATWLQPGIESLHDDALKLMKKGTQAWINVQLLKFARELGISIGWNILCGFPGEEDGWYGEMADLVPLIEHLEPSTELRPIRFDRFSPYHTNAESFGLQLVPAWPYAFIYPLDDAVLSRLVYGFESADRPKQYTNPLRLRRDELPSLGGPGRDLLQLRIKRWQDAFLSTLPPVLSMMEREDRTTIIDTREIAPQSRVELAGRAHRVHRACHASHALPQIVEGVGRDGGEPLSADEVEAELGDLVSRKLVLRLGNRYMALAVPGLLRTLPRSHREGYPGGWISRPRAAASRRRLPRTAAVAAETFA